MPSKGLREASEGLEHGAVEGDRTGDERRTTVSEAAAILGISAEAVRGRIRRGTIPVEREGGTVYVLIEGTEGEAPYDRRPVEYDRRPTGRPYGPVDSRATGPR